MDMPQSVNLAVATIALLVGLGGALALVRGSYNKARIEALRGDNSDLRERNKDVELENERLKREIETEREHHKLRIKQLEESNEHLEDEKKILMELVTQRAEVDEVLQTLNNHHDQAMGKFDSMIELLARKSNGGTRST